MIVNFLLCITRLIVWSVKFVSFVESAPVKWLFGSCLGHAAGALQLLNCSLVGSGSLVKEEIHFALCLNAQYPLLPQCYSLFLWGAGDRHVWLSRLGMCNACNAGRCQLVNLLKIFADDAPFVRRFLSSIQAFSHPHPTNPQLPAHFRRAVPKLTYCNWMGNVIK